MRKHIIDFVYLLFLDLLVSYLYFKAILNSLHIINIPLTLYVGLGLLIGIAINRIRLRLKKENINTIIFSFFAMITMGVLYIFLFDYYHYDFLHEKGSLWFVLIFISMAVSEAFYYFFSYEELKEEQDSSWFNIFKNKNSSDESHKTDEKE